MAGLRPVKPGQGGTRRKFFRSLDRSPLSRYPGGWGRRRMFHTTERQNPRPFAQNCSEEIQPSPAFTKLEIFSVRRVVPHGRGRRDEGLGAAATLDPDREIRSE